MTYQDLEKVLLKQNVSRNKVNGFYFRFSGTFYTIVEGRIPLSLARKINNDPDNKMLIRVNGGAYGWTPDEWATNAKLDEMVEEIVFSVTNKKEKKIRKVRKKYIKKLEGEGKMDDLYILKYHVDTPEGVEHVIKCIREGGYINQCVFSR